MTAPGPSQVVEKESDAIAGGKPSAEALPFPAPPPRRLVSLDAFRGFIMLWIVGGGGLMVGLQHLGQNSVIDTIVYQLNHTPWEGLRFYDCIWPCFMLMVGMSIPFSYAKRSLSQTQLQMTWEAVRRAGVLFLLGSLRESVHLGSPYLVELSSALQPIGIAYLVAFLLVRKSPRFQATVVGVIWVGYALLLALVPAPGIDAGSYTLNSNLVTYIDLALLGRAHPEGWGTGLSTIPTISTTILGLLIGELLRSSRPAKAKVQIIGAGGIGGLILGYALSSVVPVVMKMWTTSYGILTAAWACLMFLAFYWVIDVLGYRPWAFPFVVIGMNALAIYLCATVTRLPQIIELLTIGIAPALGAVGPLVSAMLLLATEWSILYWMYRRKIFLAA